MKLPKIVRDLQNVTIPEINYGFQKNISYSQMSMYRKCPHQWATQYKEGNKRYSPLYPFSFWYFNARGYPTLFRCNV